MRSVFIAICFVLLAIPGWSAVHADPGTAPERVSRGSSLDEGMGAVVISIRSALYLEDRLDVFFCAKAERSAMMPMWCGLIANRGCSRSAMTPPAIK